MISGMQRWARYLTIGSVASILFSIALSQSLLGAALLVLFYSRERLRFPPIRLPLALLLGWTLASAAHAGQFATGLPQIKKFFVFATALVVCSCLRGISDVTRLIWLWALTAVASACVGLFQLWVRYGQARAEGAAYYEYFLDARLHGLASHWMTFGGELMIVAVLLLSATLWNPVIRIRIASFVAFFVLWSVLALGLTRGVFLVGLPIGAAYLLWSWRPRTLLMLPAVIVAGSLLMPFQVKERVISVFRPHGNDDSNARRLILLRTGLSMIKAHPLLGVGPEQVGRQFDSYVPSDVPRPLPKGWYGHLHNVYLQYAAERGLPGLALLLWILGRIVWDLFIAAAHTPETGARWILHGAVGVVLAIIGEGLLEHNLGDSEILTMFLATVSCAYVVAWSASTETRRPVLVFQPFDQRSRSAHHHAS